MLTQKELKKLLNYDPKTGIFTWKSRDSKAWNTRRSGKTAGQFDRGGYILIGILGKRYLAHRLAFLYMTGNCPHDQTDHIDHDRGNNKWNNLRAVTQAENQRNRALAKNNTSGLSGVHWSKSNKKWMVRVKVNRKRIYLGSFSTKDEAIKVRKAAEIEHNFHVNHGMSI